MSQESRKAHPFHMYDAMQEQPEAFRRVVERTGKQIGEAGGAIARASRTQLVGIGTSHHAAQVGELLFRAAAPRMATRVSHAFDFALFGPELSPNEAVVSISHRGNKTYSRESLRRAASAGGLTVAITGEGGKVDTPSARYVIETVRQERSSPHTISYIGSIAALAMLARAVGRGIGRADAWDDDTLHDRLPAAMSQALALEPQAVAAAEAHLGRRRIWLAGGGAGATTAREIALKIKETSYLQAEGMSTEEMIHGPFQCAEPEDLFVLIAPRDAAQERTLALAAQALTIGAAVWVISDALPAGFNSHGLATCLVPAVPEPFSCLTCVIPLQLFTYHLALLRGTDPDGFRLEDPRFKAAGDLLTL